MNEDDQINWVSVTLDFSPDQEAVLEAAAKRKGLSLKCYCIHLVHRHFEEQQQREFLASLRRNDCPA